MDVILYTTFCPKCNVLKSKLDEAGISYKIVTSIDEMIELGIMTSPVLSVNGQLLSFIEAVDWVNNYGKED